MFDRLKNKFFFRNSLSFSLEYRRNIGYLHQEYLLNMIDTISIEHPCKVRRSVKEDEKILHEFCNIYRCNAIVCNIQFFFFSFLLHKSSTCKRKNVLSLFEPIFCNFSSSFTVDKFRIKKMKDKSYKK